MKNHRKQELLRKLNQLYQRRNHVPRNQARKGRGQRIVRALFRLFASFMPDGGP